MSCGFPNSRSLATRPALSICSYFSPESCSQLCHIGLLGICPRRPGAHLGYCCSARPTYTYLDFLALLITSPHKRSSTPWGMGWASGEADEYEKFESTTLKKKVLILYTMNSDR